MSCLFPLNRLICSHSNPLVHISLVEGWWQATPTVRGGPQTIFEWAKINLCSLKKERKRGFGKLLPSFSLAKRMWCAEKNRSGVSKKLPYDPKYFGKSKSLTSAGGVWTHRNPAGKNTQCESPLFLFLTINSTHFGSFWVVWVWPHIPIWLADLKWRGREAEYNLGHQVQPCA